MAGIANQAFSEENELEEMENGSQKLRYCDEDGKSHQRNSNCLSNGHKAFGAYFSKNQKALKICGWVAFNLVILSYLAVASVYWSNNATDCELEWCDGYGMLLIILVVSYCTLFYFYVLKKYLGKHVTKFCFPVSRSYENFQRRKYASLLSEILIYLLCLAAFIIFIIFDTAGSRERLISAVGVIFLLAIGCIFSKSPGHIKWSIVCRGLILQILLGLFTLRWSVGRAIFQCIADKVTAFLATVNDGASFVFSTNLVEVEGVFAFSVLPVVFFFSFMIQILYYVGAMQFVILKMGWLLQTLMGTTVCESINSAANTFLSMTESPLLIKPYITSLTSSEIHTIMCSGFATVSGSVLAAYIGFGAEASHLITSSVMAAPTSLYYSKLFYPETEESKTSVKNIKLQESEDSSILDAATKGALTGIPIVLGIIANIVAFVSFVALMNLLLSWFGGLVGYGDLTFELILSKVFMPLSWMMGVDWEECGDVATLIGLKTIVNEFVAFQKLGEFKEEGRLSSRAEAIATYAICGFANPSSIGIMIGGLSSLAPEKRSQVTSVAIRAFFAGCAVCFMTASIAGMLISEEFYATMTNSTSSK